MTSARQRRQNPRPAADAFVETPEIELFVGRMHTIVVERETDHECVHAQYGLEVADDRDRAADTNCDSSLAPFRF